MLGGAEGLTGVEASRLLPQDLHEELDGVIEVVLLEGGNALFMDLADIGPEFVDRLLWHGDQGRKWMGIRQGCERSLTKA